MPLLKSLALVLRTFPFSETSLIVHLLTRLHGRVTVIAKGARSPGNRFYACLDQLVCGSTVYSAKPGREVQTLTEFQVIDQFPGLRRHLDKFFAASYASELVQAVASADDPDPALFDLQLGFLGILSPIEDPRRLRVLLFAFELALLGIAGLGVRLDERCSSCGQALTGKGSGAVDLGVASLLCAACAATRPPNRIAVLSPGSIRAVQYLSSGSLEDAKRLGLPLSSEREIRRLLDYLLPYHLERRLRSRPYLARLFR